MIRIALNPAAGNGEEDTLKNIDLRRAFKIVPSLIAALLITAAAAPIVNAELNLTPEEKDYIAGARTLKAVSIDGGAPIQYRDSKGKIKGVAISVLDELAAITGLSFEYHLYSSAEEALNSGADLYFGATHQHAPKGMLLSQPYFKSEIILFINSSLDPNRLEDKIYAAVEGGTLPEGLEKKNVSYFSSREETLTAVDQGKADYGFGNAYSVAFYTLQNGYKNIITIPQKKETRKYCIALLEEDYFLLSIINKAIEEMDENQIDALVLDVASRVDRQITFPMIVDAYRREIYLIIALILLILLFSTQKNIRANKQLDLQNKRYELLSHISNECLFEYHVKTSRLVLSGNCSRIIGIKQNDNTVKDELKNLFLSENKKVHTSIVGLPLAGGGKGAFKVVFYNIYDNRKRVHSVIGKLIDVSEEMAEKEKLITKTLLDGLTGLYNPQTTRELITRCIKEKNRRRTDAFIIADCDNFKQINDTFGHLKGDQALKSIAKSIKTGFRKTDIVGRIGGDEFCIYIQNVTPDFIRAKCEQLIALIGDTGQEFHILVSMGAALTGSESTYEELFTKADKALYLAKRKGGAQIVIHGEDEPGGCREE